MAAEKQQCFLHRRGSNIFSMLFSLCPKAHLHLVSGESVKSAAMFVGGWRDKYLSHRHIEEVFLVVLAGDASILQKAALEIGASGTCSEDIPVVHVDLSTNFSQPSVNATVEKAWVAFGGLDLLLCFSTFTGPLTSFLDTSEEQLEAATSINFKCACLFSIALGKKMKVAGTGGSFVFITSIIGTERGLFPGVAIPGASIAAVNYLTRAMAMELGKYKIRVNAIARGLYESDVLLDSLSSEVLEKEGKRVVPLGRWVNKESDLTSMMLYLAADASSFITGTVVFVDGGQSLVRPRMRSYL